MSGTSPLGASGERATGDLSPSIAALTKRERYEAFIATLPANLANAIDADSQNNCFEAGPAIGPNDERYDCALATARMIADDPAAFGIKQ